MQMKFAPDIVHLNLKLKIESNDSEMFSNKDDRED